MSTQTSGIDTPAAAATARPHGSDQAAALAPARVGGKFLHAGGEKLDVHGITYGPFRPRGPLNELYDHDDASRDFARMAESGINTVRTYTVPPVWLLDLAAENGLRVMVGLPWEQHVDFLSDAGRRRGIEQSVRDGVRACAGHPAVLAYAIGNEIPAPIVRWNGPRATERFLERLYRAVKDEAPDTPATYVNYPTTEYLQLPFLDFVCFNVFLETPEALDRYLARLQNIAGDRPLVLTEIGLDSARNGEDAQAAAIDWQVRACFRAGCAGTFVFSWTDEWHRGGHEIEDWAFGLVTREREPKPALAAVRRAYAQTPMVPDPAWPRISVVVCTYNGARTLRGACEAVAGLDYPDVEAILVDDGSTDASADIGRELGFRVISTENRGLAAARNTGIAAATGDIVAFVDDDAAPDRDWLAFVADAFATRPVAGVGGPNVPVPGDGGVADCVAVSPGGPTHVLVSDREAEHIPGCNMAFRREDLLAIGGFDDRFRAAGDDVDVCWRILERGGRLGFAPGAMVWHHRRSTVRGYLRQQRSYGVAEGMLEEKWPERYSAGGHVTWRGRLYGNDLAHSARRLRWRIYYGQWGTNLFQPLYQPNHHGVDVVALLPEIYLVVALLLVITALGALWAPLLLAAPLAVGIVGLLTVRALGVASSAIFPTSPLSPANRAARLVLTTALHLLQPLVRLQGRLSRGLTLWRKRGESGLALPRRRRLGVWSEGPWRSLEDWQRALEEALRDRRAVVRRGGEFDTWDFEVRGGVLAGTRVLAAVEEHGEERQQLRFACRTRWSPTAAVAVAVLLALAGAAAASGATLAAIALAVLAAALTGRAVVEAAGATSLALQGIRAIDPFGEGSGDERA